MIKNCARVGAAKSAIDVVFAGELFIGGLMSMDRVVFRLIDEILYYDSRGRFIRNRDIELNEHG